MIMSFILEYIKHPRRIGAVAPSGKMLSRKMMMPIDFGSADVIVEYGPGTGSFTKELVANRKPNTVLILVEQNVHFCRQLEMRYGKTDNVHIIHGNAENIEHYLRQFGFNRADYIVSGLPFTSLPKTVSDSILTATKTALGDSGKFITFQYSLVKRRFFEQYFNITDYLKEVRNLPPAYVLVMQNQGEKYA
jgi:phospholipid N-methyltransferase